MSISISQFNHMIEAYLRRLGRPIVVKKSDNSEDNLFAVVQQTWRRNKTRFEDTASKIGRVRNEYYEFFGPASYDFSKLSKDDYIVFDNKKHAFVKIEKMVAGGVTQYYTGVLKRIYEEDENVFN